MICIRARAVRCVVEKARDVEARPLERIAARVDVKAFMLYDFGDSNWMVCDEVQVLVDLRRNCRLVDDQKGPMHGAASRGSQSEDAPRVMVASRRALQSSSSSCSRILAVSSFGWQQLINRNQRCHNFRIDLMIVVYDP